MLPDLWTAHTDAPPTRSLEIAPRFPQHPQPKPTIFLTDLNDTEELQILCPPPGVAGFQTFFTGRVWTFGDTWYKPSAQRFQRELLAIIKDHGTWGVSCSVVLDDYKRLVLDDPDPELPKKVGTPYGI